MRFSNPEHLEAFRDNRRYPVIHAPFAAFIRKHAKGRKFCDLGCCYGLLGERLKGHDGWDGFGVEGNPRFIGDAMNAGVTLPISCLHVTAGNVGVLGGLVRGNGATVLLARRILPELWGESPVDGKVFARCMAASGITEIFIQGRNPTVNAVNGLDTVEKEVALFAGVYTVCRVEKQLAYLTR